MRSFVFGFVLATVMVGGASAFFVWMNMPFLPSSPHPIVIPHDRIAGSRGEAIDKNAVIYCDTKLDDCIFHGFPPGTHMARSGKDADGKYHTTVVFGKASQELYSDVIPIGLLVLGLVIGIVGTTFVVYQMEQEHISDVIRGATLDRSVKMAQQYYNGMITTTKDGFRIYTSRDIPDFPTWRFRKATGKCKKSPIAFSGISKAVEMYPTIGVGFGIGNGVDIEWLPCKNMRIWVDGVAYDSYVAQD